MNYVPDENRYGNMKYNRCGRSGLKLPAISLGLWHNFGGVDTVENSRRMLWRAFDIGITHFDLANNYGPPPGSAEETFGMVFKKDFARHRGEMVISTKAGYQMWQGPYGDWGSRKYLVSSLDQSLKRMGLDYVDIFYSHRPDPETPPEETMSALSDAVKWGKALYIGISNYPADRTEKAAKILKDSGTPCLIHQPSYSMLNRWVEEALLDVLDREGIGCIAFSPLAQGLLSGRYMQGIPEDSRAAKVHGYLKRERVNEEMISKAASLGNLAQKRGQTLAQMALAWVLRKPTVTSALIGASRVEQIEENVGALDNLVFSEEELASIDAIVG